MKIRYQYAVAFILMLIASLSRLLPHPLNFTPVAAIALFGGVYFDKKFAFILPLAALLISDFFIGFYSEIVFVYAGFAVAGFLGLWIQNRKSTATVAVGTLLSSVAFFIITNYGSWLVMPDVYARSLNGLVNCYCAAVPFFRNSLAGDVFYVTVLFGTYELVLRNTRTPASVKA